MSTRQPRRSDCVRCSFRRHPAVTLDFRTAWKALRSYHWTVAISIVRLGSRREPGEGLRIGTTRRPPRGVAKARFSYDNWYDVWLPQLAPSAELVKRGQAATSAREWQAFTRSYRSEMAAPDNERLIALLAALSHTAALSVGCYCEDEERCHRATLRELLREHGAALK